ncbi:hypothetical protein ACFWYW_55640 [Nonomuraea sp. NPDC059023]|uniref:hypothetical protein n=1 Tax=unclassified Nonomuraea TaxID=2593643 RepID=UPI0036BAC32B
MTTRSPRAAKPAAGATKPGKAFDLDAVEAEAAGERFEFIFGGRSYSLPHLHDIDRSLLNAADQGDVAAMQQAFRFGLGDDYDEFDAQPMKLRSLNALFQAWTEHSGLKPGESRASTRS